MKKNQKKEQNQEDDLTEELRALNKKIGEKNAAWKKLLENLEERRKSGNSSEPLK